MPPTYHLLGEPETIQDGQLGCFHFLSIPNLRPRLTSIKQCFRSFIWLRRNSKLKVVSCDPRLKKTPFIGAKDHGTFDKSRTRPSWQVWAIDIWLALILWRFMLSVFNIYNITPLKFNMAPEKQPVEKEIDFGNHYFQGAKYTREVQTIGVEAGKKVIWMESLVSSTKISTPKTKTFSWKHIHFFVFLIGFLLVEVNLFFS